MSRVVVLDLDGTLINTEQLVDEIVGAVILDLDPSLAPSRVHDVLEKVRGTRPLDASRAVAREQSVAERRPSRECDLPVLATVQYY